MVDEEKDTVASSTESTEAEEIEALDDEKVENEGDVSKNVDAVCDNTTENEKEEIADTSKMSMEERAVAEASASADLSYSPSLSIMSSPNPEDLLSQVDGLISLSDYIPEKQIYSAKTIPVAPRTKLNVPIHITVSSCVVEYKVESTDYDIGFGVVAEREEGSTVVKEHSRVDSHLTPVTGKFLVGSVPCALMFSFDNEFSMFRDKYVTYKITVSPPTAANIRLGRRRRAGSALKTLVADSRTAQDRFNASSAQSQKLRDDILKLETDLEEKKNSYDAVLKEETWLKERVDLRNLQVDSLNKRLESGWEDDPNDDDNEMGKASEEANGVSNGD